MDRPYSHYHKRKEIRANETRAAFFLSLTFSLTADQVNARIQAAIRGRHCGLSVRDELELVGRNQPRLVPWDGGVGVEVTGPGGLDRFSSPLRLRRLHVERQHAGPQTQLTFPCRSRGRNYWKSA